MYILHFTTGFFYTFVGSHQFKQTCHTWLSFCNGFLPSYRCHIHNKLLSDLLLSGIISFSFSSSLVNITHHWLSSFISFCFLFFLFGWFFLHFQISGRYVICSCHRRIHNSQGNWWDHRSRSHPDVSINCTEVCFCSSVLTFTLQGCWQCSALRYLVVK